MKDEKNLVQPADNNEQGRQEKHEGASMVEYALLLLLIAVVAIVGVRSLGQQISKTFSGIGSQLSAG